MPLSGQAPEAKRTPGRAVCLRACAVCVPCVVALTLPPRKRKQPQRPRASRPADTMERSVEGRAGDALMVARNSTTNWFAARYPLTFRSTAGRSAWRCRYRTVSPAWGWPWAHCCSPGGWWRQRSRMTRLRRCNGSWRHRSGCCCCSAGWSAVALFFHFFAGIRHLVWDAGYGFDQPWVQPIRLGGGDRNDRRDTAALARWPRGLVRVLMAKVPHIDIMRSPLGRARGLGSARAGATHWWMQRLTALALVPLTLWFSVRP